MGLAFTIPPAKLLGAGWSLPILLHREGAARSCPPDQCLKRLEAWVGIEPTYEGDLCGFSILLTRLLVPPSNRPILPPVRSFPCSNLAQVLGELG